MGQKEVLPLELPCHSLEVRTRKRLTMSTHSSTAPKALKIPPRSASDTSDPILATNKRFSGGVGKSSVAQDVHQDLLALFIRVFD